MRVFPKSVSLMKTIRALNSYLVSVSSTDNASKFLKQNNEYSSDYKMDTSELSAYCSLAKKLYL